MLATRRRASLYIGGVWIRQPVELHMKRLLVMGMVGCGVVRRTKGKRHRQSKVRLLKLLTPMLLQR